MRKHYGVAQRRKRLILFASKYGVVKLIDQTRADGHFKTVRDAIGDLPPVEDGESTSRRLIAPGAKTVSTK